MTLNPQIRLAEKRDIEAIVCFNRAMALETEGMDLDLDTLEKGVQAVLEDPEKGFYLVSEIDGQVRACLMVTFEWSDWRNGTFYWVQSVFVDKEYRKQGLYKGLYRHLQRLISEKSEVAGLRLYVEKNNTSAQRTYTKLGMKKTDYLLFEETLKES